MHKLTIRFAPVGATLYFALIIAGALADPPAPPVSNSSALQSSKQAGLQTGKTDSAPANVYSQFDKSGAEQRPSEQDRRDEIVRTALTFRGSRYRFGGVSSKSGFDCSGFVQAMCAKWGVYLPRAARQQFSSSLGKRILPGDLKSGDLVFFSDTYRRGTSHVGIYIGEGKMIHAATPTKGVIVSDLTEEYLRKHYCGALRIDLTRLPAITAEKRNSIMAGAGVTIGVPKSPVIRLGPLGLPLP